MSTSSDTKPRRLVIHDGEMNEVTDRQRYTSRAEPQTTSWELNQNKTTQLASELTASYQNNKRSQWNFPPWQEMSFEGDTVGGTLSSSDVHVRRKN